MTQRESFAPIVNASALPLFDFGNLSAPSSGHVVLVYLPLGHAESSVDVYRDHPPAFDKRMKQRFWRYEIDVAHHSTWVTLQLPAKEKAFSFTARVCFTWRVSDAAAVARSGLPDAKAVIWGYLNQFLRAISRQYSIEESSEAEEDMNRRLEKESGQLEHGLQLSSMTVDLYLDVEAQQHLARRVTARRESELAHDQHGLLMLREAHNAEQARLRGDLERAHAQFANDLQLVSAEHARELELATAAHTRELEIKSAGHARDLELAATSHASDIDRVRTEQARILETANARHARQLAVADAEHAQRLEVVTADHARRLESANNEHARELESVIARHELALKKERVRFYHDAMRGDDFDFVVFQLIEHPEDIRAVIDMMQAGKDVYYARTREVVRDLLDKEMVHPADVGPLREHAIEQLTAALNLAAPASKLTVKRSEETTIAAKLVATKTESASVIAE